MPFPNAGGEQRKSDGKDNGDQSVDVCKAKRCFSTQDFQDCYSKAKDRNSPDPMRDCAGPDVQKCMYMCEEEQRGGERLEKNERRPCDKMCSVCKELEDIGKKDCRHIGEKYGSNSEEYSYCR